MSVRHFGRRSAAILVSARRTFGAVRRPIADETPHRSATRLSPNPPIDPVRSSQQSGDTCPPCMANVSCETPQDPIEIGTFPMRSSHSPQRLSEAFSDRHAVADAGLLLPATLTATLGLKELIDEQVSLGDAAWFARSGLAETDARRLSTLSDGVRDGLGMHLALDRDRDHAGAYDLWQESVRAYVANAGNPPAGSGHSSEDGQRSHLDHLHASLTRAPDLHRTAAPFGGCALPRIDGESPSLTGRRRAQILVNVDWSAN